MRDRKAVAAVRSSFVCPSFSSSFLSRPLHNYDVVPRHRHDAPASPSSLDHPALESRCKLGRGFLSRLARPEDNRLEHHFCFSPQGGLRFFSFFFLLLKPILALADVISLRKDSRRLSGSHKSDVVEGTNRFAHNNEPSSISAAPPFFLPSPIFLHFFISSFLLLSSSSVRFSLVGFPL